ncbi:MAG: hypothetical protein JXA78_15040 [Anaerolineales bacterium]|nr:hypothetical protein [Anaerolineales bacterium]
MYQSTYFIEKSSNTFADNLAVFGLAYVIDAIAERRARVHIEDRGYAFAVVCNPAIQPGWVQQRQFFAGAPFLLTLDNKTQCKMVKGTDMKADKLPQGGDVLVDYQMERQNVQDYFNWMRSLPDSKERRKAMTGELAGPATRHVHWDLFRAINPGALQGYNGLMAEWWLGQEAFPELLGILLGMVAQVPNDLYGALERWKQLAKERGWETKPKATAMQLFNPAQGKGINNPKATWSSPGNLKSFWLLEWLKAVGIYYGGFTNTIAGAKDRKTYVLMPRKLDWGRHQAVMKDFRQSMVTKESAVKMDIMAALRYTMAFLKHYEDARPEDPLAKLFGESPSDLVDGMQTAFYKDLGNATATMNIASINLPRWVAPRNPEELSLLSGILDEHIQVVRNLDESRGNQFNLLSSYRDFLSGNDLDPFFEFTTAYSGFILSQRERGKFVRQFSTTSLEVLFMNSDEISYSQIVQNEGFKDIAYAIRHSTVIPQYQKRPGSPVKPAVDVRYGLGQQLARKAAYPDEFLAELSEFMQLYNAENAQLREKGRNPFRKNITTADIQAITELVDVFGSRVICNMLIAYGYASERSGQQAQEPGMEEHDTLSGDGDNETGNAGDEE